MGAGCGLQGENRRSFEGEVASDRNYDVYWFGRSFAVGDVVFKGPHVNDFGIGDVDGGGLTTEYNSTLPSGGCCGTLNVVMYSRPAWARIEPIRAPGRQLSEVKNVTVDGHPAEFITRRNRPRELRPGEVNSRGLVIDYGTTVVEIGTSALPPTPTDPQPNPLIDEATFLAVMQNLRPYPQ